MGDGELMAPNSPAILTRFGVDMLWHYFLTDWNWNFYSKAFMGHCVEIISAFKCS